MSGKYYVTLDFKKGPSFGYEVTANNWRDAEKIARREAPGYGFNEQVAKATVREA